MANQQPIDLLRQGVNAWNAWRQGNPGAGPDVGQFIANTIPESRFAVMGDCGHWPQFEDPETFKRIHLNFLQGKPVPEAAKV